MALHVKFDADGTGKPFLHKASIPPKAGPRQSSTAAGWFTGRSPGSSGTDGGAANALTRSLERPPDLIVLDTMLPGLDGLEVARRLRAGGDNMPILMLTARDAAANWVSVEQLGGHITVASIPGQRSTFSIWLPIAPT